VTRRFATPVLVVVLALVAAGCGDDAVEGATTTTATGAPPEDTATTEAATDEPDVDVIIQGFAFNPAQLTVAVGDTIRWMNLDDGVSHTVTADDGTFAGSVTGSRSFRFTATDPGVYDYSCTIHPEMRATLIVE
jgi:plastocyanin